MTEPEINWAEEMRHDDLSSWYDVVQPVIERCCEAQWLPTTTGEYVECPKHDVREH